MAVFQTRVCIANEPLVILENRMIELNIPVRTFDYNYKLTANHSTNNYTFILKQL